jgi:hypothetical protein
MAQKYLPFDPFYTAPLKNMTLQNFSIEFQQKSILCILFDFLA